MSEDMARTATVEDETLLSHLSATEDPVRTVGDLADELPLSYDGIRHRLKQLEDEGRVRSKKVGSRAVVWWPDD